MMNFNERGYRNEFGYGAYEHVEKNEMLILDTGVFGPNCQNGDGRQFKFRSPDGHETSCVSIWDAMAMYLSDSIGRNVEADNKDIETATRQMIEAIPGAEKELHDAVYSIVDYYMGLECAYGHRPSGDLKETGDAKLILDMPGDEIGDIEPFWGTVADASGNMKGRNMFGQILMEVRAKIRPEMKSAIGWAQGYHLSR